MGQTETDLKWMLQYTQDIQYVIMSNLLIAYNILAKVKTQASSPLSVILSALQGRQCKDTKM